MEDILAGGGGAKFEAGTAFICEGGAGCTGAWCCGGGGGGGGAGALGGGGLTGAALILVATARLGGGGGAMFIFTHWLLGEELVTIWLRSLGALLFLGGGGGGGGPMAFGE